MLGKRAPADRERRVARVGVVRSPGVFDRKSFGFPPAPDSMLRARDGSSLLHNAKFVSKCVECCVALGLTDLVLYGRIGYADMGNDSRDTSDVNDARRLLRQAGRAAVAGGLQIHLEPELYYYTDLLIRGCSFDDETADMLGRIEADLGLLYPPDCEICAGARAAAAIVLPMRSFLLEWDPSSVDCDPLPDYAAQLPDKLLMWYMAVCDARKRHGLNFVCGLTEYSDLIDFTRFDAALRAAGPCVGLGAHPNAQPAMPVPVFFQAIMPKQERELLEEEREGLFHLARHSREGADAGAPSFILFWRAARLHTGTLRQFCERAPRAVVLMDMIASRGPMAELLDAVGVTPGRVPARGALVKAARKRG